MIDKQTKKATETRSRKKNEQDYQYQQLFRELVKEHCEEEYLCVECMKLNFCGTKHHPTTNFLAKTLTTLGYPPPSQVEVLGLKPYNVIPADMTDIDYETTRSSIELKDWDKTQVQRVISNKESVSEFSLANFYDED